MPASSHNEAVTRALRQDIIGRRTASRLLSRERFDDDLAERLLIAQEGRDGILLPSLRVPSDFEPDSHVLIPGQTRKSHYVVTDADRGLVVVKNVAELKDTRRLALNSLVMWGNEEFWELRDPLPPRCHSTKRIAAAVLELEIIIGGSHSPDEIAEFTRWMCGDVSPITRSRDI